MATRSATGEEEQAERYAHEYQSEFSLVDARRGLPLELVARQFGHRDVVMVAKVYGRVAPNR